MLNQSFEQAHSGRCPGCSIIDGGNHIVHRYDNSIPGGVGFPRGYTKSARAWMLRDLQKTTGKKYFIDDEGLKEVQS